MIGLDDPLFWLAVGALAVAVRALPPRSQRWRPALYALATLFLFHPRAGWPIGGCLVLIATYGYLALRSTRGKVGVAAHATVMAGLFVGSQYATAVLPGVPGLERILPLIGLPYLFLRFVHLLIEVADGRVQRPSYLVYLAYLLPFHQILAGPIQRYPDFAAQVLDSPVPPLSGDVALQAVNRITNGFVKKAILAQLLLDVVGFRFESKGLGALVEMDLFAIWLYLDFSGYMDIVIGAGRLVGWVPPENFDWPYLSRNIVIFWTRWHISLSEWIRDYVFTPVNLGLRRRWLADWPLLAGVISYLVSMELVGLWHRANLQFALYGLMQGGAIALFKVWEAQLRKRLGRDGVKRYQASPAIRAAATFVTFQYAALGHLVAFHPPRQVLAILAAMVGLA